MKHELETFENVVNKYTFVEFLLFWFEICANCGVQTCPQFALETCPPCPLHAAGMHCGIWGWPCTALRAQYGQPFAGLGHG